MAQDITGDVTKRIIRYDETWTIPDNWHVAIMKACRAFTDGMRERDTFYRETRNATKPLTDIMVGKYGEIFAMQCLTAKGFPSIPVDLAIYAANNKSWAADLPYRGVDGGLPDVHVKTCDLNTVRFVSGKTIDGQALGRYSWTFNVGSKDGWGKDSAIDSKRDVVALVYIPSLEARSGTLVATIPTAKLRGLLKPPVSDKLKGIKLCVYDSDVTAN